MPDEIVPHAQPITPGGDAEWFPPAEDDTIAAPQPPQRGIRWIFFGKDGFRAGWSLLLFLLLAGLVAAGCSLVAHALTGSTYVVRRGVPFHPLSVFLYTHGTILVAVLVAAFVLSRIEHRPMRAYGLATPRGRGLQIASGFAWGIALFSLVILLLHSQHLLFFDVRLLTGAAIWKWGAAWLLAFTCVAFAEEYMMRGYALFTLSRGFAGVLGAFGLSDSARKRYGFWCAALAFSFLFGLAHGNNPGESPIGLWSAGLIGLVFAYSLWRTGSLWWAIAWHAAWDWAESFLFGTADSGSAILHPLWSTHTAGPLWMSGGPTGPEGSVFVLLIIALTVAVIAITLKPEPGSPALEAATASDLPAR